MDPAGVAQLLEDYINLRQVREGVGGREDALAELLMLGGRHYYLTGDVNFAKAHIEQYHAAAHRLLSTIPAGQALPVCTLSWDGQGIVMGKEPYFTAECYAGLNRLADMEEALGDADSSIQWRNAAAAMKHAALTDYREGGLWHSDRGTFINFIDYKDPQISTPQGQNWSPGKMVPPGIPRREFALYETIVPIWLGLLDDEQKVHQVYEWIDSHYSYASGRGELTFPPFIIQNFVALLDVAVRQKYHVPADNLLQLLTNHALDAGIPVAERAYGSYGHGTAYQAHVGRIWDNAPFFAIVLNQHYGLDYSYQGWLIREPRPLANYSLTRLENVRHKNAVYSLSWQGTGTVESILVDGKTWPARLLNLTEGSHTVLIKLHE